MNLVIVESPGKVKKIQEYLGSSFNVVACFGHCIDLDPHSLSVNIKKDFDPNFVVLEDKKKVIENIKEKAKSSKCVYLFMDADREGEGMARNVSMQLPKSTKWKRGRFQAITKKEIELAIKESGTINQSMVDSYEARRILDRLCGYKTSFLTQQATGGKSAGRVQSAILRIIVDREKEIISFIPIEYWVLTADFTDPKNQKYTGVLDEKIEVKNQEQSQKIYDDIIKGSPVITSVESKESISKSVSPFTTSTMIQSVSTVLGWPASKTMKIAQSLYEKGFSTYLRTDSVYIVPDFVSQIRNYIQLNFDSSYLPKSEHIYQSKKGSQEAHECIRVTNLDNSPNKSGLFGDEKKLYDVIWKRTVACQMSFGKDMKTKVVTSVGNYDFISRGSVLVFDGYRKIWNYSLSDDYRLPNLTEGDKCVLENLVQEQKFTTPPSRYSDASLSKKCETEMISRPATFANCIKTLMDRMYIESHNKSYKATDLGIRVIDFLTKSNFCFADIGFTRDMEQMLDEIVTQKKDKVEVLNQFWNTLKNDIENGKKIKNNLQLTEFVCPKCGGYLVSKFSKFGKFFSCQNYKKNSGCDYIAVVDENGNPKEKVIKEKEYASFLCEKCQGKMIKRNSKYGEFYGCSQYPQCRSTASIDGVFKVPSQSKKYSKWKKSKKSGE